MCFPDFVPRPNPGWVGVSIPRRRALPHRPQGAHLVTKPIEKKKKKRRNRTRVLPFALESIPRLSLITISSVTVLISTWRGRAFRNGSANGQRLARRLGTKTGETVAAHLQYHGPPAQIGLLSDKPSTATPFENSSRPGGMGDEASSAGGAGFAHVIISGGAVRDPDPARWSSILRHMFHSQAIWRMRRGGAALRCAVFVAFHQRVLIQTRWAVAPIRLRRQRVRRCGQERPVKLIGRQSP